MGLVNMNMKRCNIGSGQSHTLVVFYLLLQCLVSRMKITIKLINVRNTLRSMRGRSNVPRVLRVPVGEKITLCSGLGSGHMQMRGVAGNVSNTNNDFGIEVGKL